MYVPANDRCVKMFCGKKNFFGRLKGLINAIKFSTVVVL